MSRFIIPFGMLFILGLSRWRSLMAVDQAAWHIHSTNVTPKHWSISGTSPSRMLNQLVASFLQASLDATPPTLAKTSTWSTSRWTDGGKTWTGPSFPSMLMAKFKMCSQTPVSASRTKESSSWSLSTMLLSSSTKCCSFITLMRLISSPGPPSAASSFGPFPWQSSQSTPGRESSTTKPWQVISPKRSRKQEESRNSHTRRRGKKREERGWKEGRSTGIPLRMLSRTLWSFCSLFLSIP